MLIHNTTRRLIRAQGVRFIIYILFSSFEHVKIKYCFDCCLQLLTLFRLSRNIEKWFLRNLKISSETIRFGKFLKNLNLRIPAIKLPYKSYCQMQRCHSADTKANKLWKKVMLWKLCYVNKLCYGRKWT